MWLGCQGFEQDDGFYQAEQREEYVLWEAVIGVPANMIAVEFATVGRTKTGAIYHHLWGADDIDALLREHDLGGKKDGEETTEQAMGSAGYAENRPET